MYKVHQWLEQLWSKNIEYIDGQYNIGKRFVIAARVTDSMYVICSMKCLIGNWLEVISNLDNQNIIVEMMIVMG